MRKLFKVYDQLPTNSRFLAFLSLMLIAVGIIPTLVCLIKHDIKWFSLIELTCVTALLIPRMLYIHNPQVQLSKTHMKRDIDKIGGC